MDGQQFTDYTKIAAREFFYDGPHQRYLVRQRDATLPASWPAPPENPYLEPVGDDRWHEYVGNQIHADFMMDLSDPYNPVVNVDARYTHAGAADGRLLAIEGGPSVPPGSERFFHADMLGTTRLLTDGDGSVSQSLAFTAFGEALGTAPASSPRYGYAGAWGYQTDGTDAQGAPLIDLPYLHVGARYYNPVLGRFLGRDPIGIFGGLNVYAYAGANPLLYVDPTGRLGYPNLLLSAAAIIRIGATLALPVVRAGAHILEKVSPGLANVIIRVQLRLCQLGSGYKAPNLPRSGTTPAAKVIEEVTRRQ